MAPPRGTMCRTAIQAVGCLARALMSAVKKLLRVCLFLGRGSLSGLVMKPPPPKPRPAIVQVEMQQEDHKA